MIRWYRGPAGALAVVLLAGAPGERCIAADPQGEWQFAFAPGMVHFRPSPEHKPVWAIGIERQRADGFLGGASFFSNSFGQDSSYYYLGQRYRGLAGRPEPFLQWSAGLLYGYRGKYEDKVPMNHNGYSPGAVATMGWVFNRDGSAQLNLLGDAGVMLQLNYAFR